MLEGHLVWKGARSEDRLNSGSDDAFYSHSKCEHRLAMGHLYALDFDGVLCDSAGESSISALKVLAHSVPLRLRL